MTNCHFCNCQEIATQTTKIKFFRYHFTKTSSYFCRVFLSARFVARSNSISSSSFVSSPPVLPTTSSNKTRHTYNNMSWASIACKTPKPTADSSSVALTAKEGLKLLVVDANAIIDGVKLEGIADKAVTIQEVLDEIKDKQSRQFLASLPYQLEVSEPSEESVQAGGHVVQPGSYSFRMCCCCILSCCQMCKFFLACCQQPGLQWLGAAEETGATSGTKLVFTPSKHELLSRVSVLCTRSHPLCTCHR